MTLIEGFGDEVIHFFSLLAVVFIALIAWWSTNLSERPLIRTVFILERRTIRRNPADTETITADVTETTDVIPEENELVEENKTSQSNTNAENQVEVSVVEPYINSEETLSSESSSEVIPQTNNENPENNGGQERNIIDSANDSVVRNRILAFFKARQEQRNFSGQTDNAENGNVMNEGTCPEAEKSDDGNIRIRLKYLNDDLKLVEGKLQEKLGDFKRRHFSLELAGRKLVRLIFKGQVLQEDTKTLQNCGFFDNCVVHCLVQSNTPPPSPNLNRSRNETQSHDENSQHWDLGNILFASLSLLLGLAWYGRYQYAYLYTATTTVALIGLTGIFTVSLIGMYMPDTDGVRT